MKNTNLLNTLNRSFHKVGFQMKKHSPTILVGAGIVGVVASTVMACKATTKVSAILDDSKKQIDQIHNCMENEELINEGKYNEKDGKKDLTIVYTQTGLKLVKLYGPSVLLGTVSIVSILASHRILTKRNAAISAAYAVVDKGFKDYRKRVKERFGERVDYELKNNIKAEQIKTIDIDENGNQVEVTKTIDVVQNDSLEYSVYARFFDELNPYYQKDAEYNLMFLKMTQANLNRKLQEQGYLFLNEAYEALGIEKTKAGQVFGWIYDTKNPIGDNYVDFGIHDVHKKAAREFVNGYEKAVLLDFNVDGNILELMK